MQKAFREERASFEKTQALAEQQLEMLRIKLTEAQTKEG
jgi:hypothetical protein